MDSVLVELGVGGIFALLVIDRVLAFLKTRNRNSDKRLAGSTPPAGSMPVDFWQKEHRATLNETVIPLLTSMGKTNEAIERGIERLVLLIDERMPRR